MSLIFISTWIRDIDKRYKVPWEDNVEKCVGDPMWTCVCALNNFYKHIKIEDSYIEPIPPYLVHDSVISHRRRRKGHYNYWQCTDIDSVNNRIRIYK